MDESNWLLEVVEAMSDGVVIVDHVGAMLLVNRELERMLGYTAAEAVGQPLAALIVLPEDEARYRAMVMDALARDRRLCVVQLRPGHEAHYAGKPAVHPVGGVGEILAGELACGHRGLLACCYAADRL